MYYIGRSRIGPQGKQGVPGSSGVAGAQGAQGTAGKTVLNGTGAPVSGVGVQGDYYINNSDLTLWGPKVNNTQWPSSGTALRGPQGAPGTNGTNGATGPAGATGATGPSGTVSVGSVSTGSPGTNVTVSNSGTSTAAVLNFTIPRGYQGYTGATGAQGASGSPWGGGTFSGIVNFSANANFNADAWFSGGCSPNVDNTSYLGIAQRRWLVVYAANGTINTSDRRNKTNIQDSILGLDFIKKLNPVSYDFNFNYPEPESPHGYNRYGFIAQEVEETLNGTPFGGLSYENDTYGLDYAQFIAPLVKAVQEQQSMIEALQKEVATLKAA